MTIIKWKSFKTEINKIIKGKSKITDKGWKFRPSKTLS